MSWQLLQRLRLEQSRPPRNLLAVQRFWDSQRVLLHETSVAFDYELEALHGRLEVLAEEIAAKRTTHGNVVKDMRKMQKIINELKEAYVLWAALRERIALHADGFEIEEVATH